MTTCFQQLAILHTGGANLLAGTTPETSIDMFAKRFGSVGQFAFGNCTHQVQSAAWSVVFVAGDYVGRTGFEAEATVDAGQKPLLLLGQRVNKVTQGFG